MDKKESSGLMLKDLMVDQSSLCLGLSLLVLAS